MGMTTQEFKRLFDNIKSQGFLPTKRRGPTGIGFTLETLLGIAENNQAHPDIDGAELKAHRIKSNNLITLFTFNKKVWKIKPLDAIKQFGSKDANGRLGLYYTMSLKQNSAGLFLYVEKKALSVRHISGVTVAEWQMDTITERFNQKIPALIFVSAFVEERDNIEHFHFYRAQKMSGTSAELLADQFRAENIVVDLRLHDAGTKPRNHGTGFRAYEDKLPYIFSKVEDIV